MFKREDLLLLLLFLALVAAAVLTILFGGNRSRHGYGAGLRSPAIRPLCRTAEFW
jgi:hypothetical protein